MSIPDPCSEQDAAVRATQAELEQVLTTVVESLLIQIEERLAALDLCRRNNPWPGPLIPESWLQRTIRAINEWISPPEITRKLRRVRDFARQLDHFCGALRQ